MNTHRLLAPALAVVLMISTLSSSASASSSSESTLGNRAEKQLSSQKPCGTLTSNAAISMVAKAIVADRVTQTVVACCGSLTESDKSLVFEAMALERGMLQALREETLNDLLARRVNPRQLASGMYWKQLIERIPFSAIGKTLRSVTNSYASPYCDGSDPDVDITFVVTFPYSVSNPDSLRSFSANLGVDAMLVYYQVKYGGLNGQGWTDSRYVYLCIGPDGVSNAGGEQNVRNNLKLHDNN